jgi:hypothetical protein
MLEIDTEQSVAFETTMNDHLIGQSLSPNGILEIGESGAAGWYPHKERRLVGAGPHHIHIVADRLDDAALLACLRIQ